MQEINHARQESSAQSSSRKEYRCRVCDGPAEWPDIVCRECWKRDREEQEWESYLDFLDGDDTTPENPELLTVFSSVGSISNWFSRWILFSLANGLF